VGADGRRHPVAELGRADVDETALFAMVEPMRAITDAASATTRKARRDRERRSAVPAPPGRPEPTVPPPPGTAGAEAKPFEVIEQW